MVPQLSLLNRKVCNVCGKIKPFDLFSPEKETYDRLRATCKACKAAQRAQWREENPERNRQIYMAGYYRHHERRKQAHREWYAANIEQQRAYSKQYEQEHKHVRKAWRDANQDHLKVQGRRRYRANPEKFRLAARDFYYRNTEACLARGSEWAKKHRSYLRDWERTAYHKDKTRWVEKKQRRYARKKGAAGDHTDAQWRELCALYDYRCLACNRRVRLTRDHVIPLVKGGSNDISNIQPLCQSCNSTKNDRDWDYR